MAKRLQSVRKAIRVAARHLVAGFRDPREARAFLRYVGAYDDGMASHLVERSLHDIYPGIANQEVTLRHRFEPWSLPYGEAFVLAQITACLQPKSIFEIGTFTGGSTLIMAQHSPLDAQVYTLDLPPDRLRLPGDEPEQSERIGERFRGTPYARKITQLVGDSGAFDFSPYSRSMQLVFIDAVHTYEYVMNDSRAALDLLSQGGVIIWDDCSAEQPGVITALDELATSMPIWRIAGTRFALFRDTNHSPAPAPEPPA
jgi:hypothetical protein